MNIHFVSTKFSRNPELLKLLNLVLAKFMQLMVVLYKPLLRVHNIVGGAPYTLAGFRILATLEYACIDLKIAVNVGLQFCYAGVHVRKS